MKELFVPTMILFGKARTFSEKYVTKFAKSQENLPKMVRKKCQKGQKVRKKTKAI